MRQAPVWTTEQNSVSLTIYRAPEPKAEVQLSQRQKVFLDTAQPGGIYKTSDYAEITGVVVGQAQRDVSELLELGFLQRRGKGRAAYSSPERWSAAVAAR
jgi:Fic family protein